MSRVPGYEYVTIGGTPIPVIGYVNCTGGPLPDDAANSRRISEFLAHKTPVRLGKPITTKLTFRRVGHTMKRTKRGILVEWTP